MNVIQGDCLEIMREMLVAELKFDAIITDPPYALTKGDDTPYHALRVLSQIVFPNLDQLESKIGDQFSFSGIPVTVANLNLVDWAVGIESRIGMPESAIHFYRNFQCWQNEINDGGKSSQIISDNELSSEDDPKGSEFLGDYILDLRDTWKFARTNGYASSFAELSSGCLTVPICAVFAPSSPTLLARFCSVILGADHVRFGDDSFRKSQTHADTFAAGGTVNSFMLRFDLGRSSIELHTANRTFTGNNFSSIIPPKLVATPPATGSLSTEFQPIRVCCILSPANRTNTYFNLWIHKNWAKELSRIYSSGGFMGQVWDDALPDPEIWRLAYELLVPGGHIAVFGGTRTYHRLCCAIEDAGFEIRDQLAWVYGSGLPKGTDVSKAIDKMLGAEREVVDYDASRARPNRKYKSGAIGNLGGHENVSDRSDNGATITAPATPEAKRWEGWRTTLKPAWEPIVLARKPFPGSVPGNVLKYGTAALNVDACRIPIDEAVDDPRLGGKGTWGTAKMAKNVYEGGYEGIRVGSSPDGRYPPNLIHDGSDEVLELFAQYGERGGGDNRGQCQGRRPGGFGDVGHDKGDEEPNATVYADKGSAARFFYHAKANKLDRRGSKHPTIKPINLMRWLAKLITPPNGIILDPFAGTGTTAEAAILEGFEYLMIEREAEYIQDIKNRLSNYPD